VSSSFEGVAALVDETHGAVRPLVEHRWGARRHQRRFIACVGQLQQALARVPMADVRALSVENRRRLGERIEQIVDDVEQCIAACHARSVSEVRRYQHLVEQTYQLRIEFERIWQGQPPDPSMLDVRAEDRYLRHGVTPAH
jgi:ABC-type phosphate transport system auxiliary subunit